MNQIFQTADQYIQQDKHNKTGEQDYQIKLNGIGKCFQCPCKHQI